MPGEQAWPTQPYPTVPPPFARQKMTADDVNPYILTAEERAAWKDRISKMRNEGLFTPPGLEETLSLPGARGGSNWGTSAANPAKGLVYLTTQDWPTIYKLSLDDPLAARRVASAAAGADQGRAIYERRCQSCHGPNGDGPGGGPPAVAGDSVSSSTPSARSLQVDEAKCPHSPIWMRRPSQPSTHFLPSLRVRLRATFQIASARQAPATEPVVASGGAPGGSGDAGSSNRDESARRASVSSGS